MATTKKKADVVVGAAEAAIDQPIAAKAAPTKPAMLRITARREGFRRAGRTWSRAPIDLPASDFTAEHLAALRAEPMLAVVEVE